MAVDTGQPGLAQRYYIQALRLAQAAGDRGYGGYVLAASHEPSRRRSSATRGRSPSSRAPRRRARAGRSPRAREAMFHAAEARGHALLGDARACQAVAGPGGRRAGARRRRDAGDDPAWIAHFDQAYLADELAHCHRDLGQAEAGRAARARSPWPGTRSPGPAAGPSACCCSPTRAGAAARGGAGLPHGHRRRSSCWATLRSNRGAEYLDDFQQRLEPYRDEPVVREFGARLELQAA